MERQYKQMEREYESIIGSRGMGELLNQATRLTLPDGFESNYHDLIQNGEAGASAEAKPNPTSTSRRRVAEGAYAPFFPCYEYNQGAFNKPFCSLFEWILDICQVSLWIYLR